MIDDKRELQEIEASLEHALETIMILLRANARHAMETASKMGEIARTFKRSTHAAADLQKQMTDLDHDMT